MAEHTVASFDQELDQVDRLIREMGDLAGSMVQTATRALLGSDTALAQHVISDDVVMDAKQRELDDRAITLIAKRVGAVGQSTTPRNLSHSIEGMAALVLAQVKGAVDFYVGRDAEGLKALRTDDEQIDIQYTAAFRELLTYMMEDPRNITACTHLLFCAKNLERIGDHVTNIAENAYYVMTGTQLPQQRPKLDETTVSAPAQ